MKELQLYPGADVGSSHTLRAKVVAVLDDGAVCIATEGDHILCDILRSSDQAELGLAEGDTVLAWHSGQERERGVVLGRVGPTDAGEPDMAELPDELVVEAKKNLTLRCGAGSITLREDGKILIKGKELVSHARKTNRIKGGSVTIN